MLHSIGLADPTINYAPFAPYPTSSTLSANAISQPDTNPNPMLSALPRSAHGISSATTAAMAAAAAAASAGISPNIKDSRWLTLEVCRQYQRNQCSRDESECKFAHPPTHVDVQSGRVVCCYDSIKGKCQRRDPPCKYLHPPQHLKEQLIQNGRNNMIMRNMQFQLLTQQYLAQGGLVPLTAAAAAAVAAANAANNSNGVNTNPAQTGTTSNSLLYGTPALTIGAPGTPNPYQVLKTTTIANSRNPSTPSTTIMDELFNRSSSRFIPHSLDSADLPKPIDEPPTKLQILALLGHDPTNADCLQVASINAASACRNTNTHVNDNHTSPVVNLNRSGWSRKRSHATMQSGRVGIGSASSACLGSQALLDLQPNKHTTMGFSPYLNGLSTSGLPGFHGVTGPPTLPDSNGHLPMRSTLSDMKNGMNLYSPSAAAAALAHLNGMSATKQENGDSLNGCVMLMNGTSLDSMKPKELNTSHTNGSSMPLNSMANGHSGTNGTGQTSQPNGGMHNGTSVTTNNTNNHNNNNNLAVVASLISWQQNGAPMAIPHPTPLTTDSLTAAVAAAAAANGAVGPANDMATHYPALPDHPAYFQPAYANRTKVDDGDHDLQNQSFDFGRKIVSVQI